MDVKRRFILTVLIILCASYVGVTQNLRLSATDSSEEEFSSRAAGEAQDNLCFEEIGDQFSLRMKGAFGLQGSSLCLSVTARNFTDIFSIQTGIEWNPNVLKFTEIRDVGLQSVNVDKDDVDEGKVNILWLFNQSAISLPNGSTLFKLCFEVIGNSGQTTNLSFVDNPEFPIEFADGSGRINSFSTYDALFTIGEGHNSCGAPTVHIIDQIGEIQRTGIVGQQFPDSQDARFQSADNFIIPTGPDLVLDNVFIQGFYFNPNPSTGRNCDSPINTILEIYTNVGGLPGSLVFEETFDSAISDQNRDGTFNLELRNKLQLASGTYWLSVMQEMPFFPCGQFAWRHSKVDRGGSSPIAFRDTDGLSSNSCRAWANFETCIGSPEPFSALAFSMDFTESPKIVPTISEWSIICLGLLLFILGVVATPYREGKQV